MKMTAKKKKKKQMSHNQKMTSSEKMKIKPCESNK